MRCNACWKDLDGRAITTTCGHLFCTEDASKILSNEAACPVCDLVLSKSHMKPVDVNPNDEWTNTTMFWQICEQMQEKFTEKLEQVHTAYQIMAEACQMMEQENENLLKDKQELQEKLAEISRQKRKRKEMYDQLRSEYESVKRSAIQPASNFYPRAEPDLFANPTNMMGNMDSMRKDWGILTPETPGPREGMLTTRQTSSNSFDIQGASPANKPSAPADNGNRRHSGHPSFGAGASNPSMTLRNLP